MRFTADSSRSFLSGFLTTHPSGPLRAFTALALVASLAACGGDGAGSAGTASSTSAKPGAASSTIDDAASGKKDDGEVRYAP